MHAIFLTRGIKQSVDHLTMDMQSQKFLFNFKDKKGKHQKIWLQGALRPIQLWEYVFPKEDADLVLTSLDFDGKSQHVKNCRRIGP